MTGPAACRSCAAPLASGGTACGACGAATPIAEEPAALTGLAALAAAAPGVPPGYGSASTPATPRADATRAAERPLPAEPTGPAEPVAPADPTAPADPADPTAPVGHGQPGARQAAHETAHDGTEPAPPAERAEQAASSEQAGRPEQADTPEADTVRPAHPAPDVTPTAATSEENVPETRCVACGIGTVADQDGSAQRCGHCGHEPPRAHDHWERDLGILAAASDLGLRHQHNEDFFALATAATPDGDTARIALVCDGVSSAARSDEASAAAAEAASASIQQAVPRGIPARRAMHDALVAASDAVVALVTTEDRTARRNAPACTIVGTVVGGGILTVGWIGDSRAYWIPDDRTAPPARLTEDDSWAAQVVAAGLMSESEAYADPRAHAITGWLGADAYELEPHTASFTPEQAGAVIVCSDGLWNYAESAAEIAALVPGSAATEPMRCARHLVGHALDSGGGDNVTVAVVPCPAPSEPLPPPDPENPAAEAGR